MKFTAHRQDGHAVIVRHVTVEDAPVLDARYTSKQFRPSYVSIEYTLKGGSWLVDGGYSISVCGDFLKKDGTPSKAYHRGHAPFSFQDFGPEYQWLADLIDRLRPTDFPLLPEVSE